LSTAAASTTAPTGTFFDALVEATVPDREGLLAAPAIRRGAAGDLGLASYLAFLEQAYHHVRHTVPLLMACGARLPARLAWMQPAVATYIAEEQGHEAWILADIAAAGGDSEAVRNGRPGRATEVMVAYAYDLVNRRNPVGLFGMVLVLEGTSVALARRAAANIQAALRLPDAAFTYLARHGDLDVGHMAFFASLMNRLQAPEDRDAVLHAARMFFHLYGDIFRSLPLVDAGG
jgi:pyrroloquinoline quinone (PQQ) biosynthesis protein C